MSLDDLFKELDEIEDKQPKKEKKAAIIKETKSVPRGIIEKIEIPDFNALLKYCEKHLDDYEVEQFYKHSIPRRLHKTKYQEDRGGGGWSGAVKATINILLKMKKEGVL